MSFLLELPEELILLILKSYIQLMSSLEYKSHGFGSGYEARVIRGKFPRMKRNADVMLTYNSPLPLLRLRSLNKLFNQLVFEPMFWQRLDLGTRMPWLNDKPCNRITSPSAMIKVLSNVMDNIKELRVDGCVFSINGRVIDYIVKNGPNLEYLDASNCLGLVDSYVPNSQIFDENPRYLLIPGGKPSAPIETPDPTTPAFGTFMFGYALPKLHSLILAGHVHLANETIVRISRGCPVLQNLECSMWQHLTDISPLAKLSTLKRLILSQAKLLTDEAFETLVKTPRQIWPNLELLDLTSSSISSFTLTMFSTHPNFEEMRKKLSTIRLTETDVDGVGVRALRSFSQLTIIHLRGCRLVEDDSVTSFATSTNRTIWILNPLGKWSFWNVNGAEGQPSSGNLSVAHSLPN
jgi:hypothetical protein